MRCGTWRFPGRGLSGIIGEDALYDAAAYAWEAMRASPLENRKNCLKRSDVLKMCGIISVLATTIPTAKFPPLSVFPVTTGPPESPGLLHTDKDERFLICLPL